ncbi:S41 family peptidase [Vitiosangium sp. GDMCC 1.1324]|uniref:S41 family peptidase n=1 Tax=Vitiosangium sp. (strain GDMCC 1.1324) TaxID=2138576 RepID=UPI00130D4DE5|nr:S41 family peptidase [Vitiosangium sp. GDMCC 1.1324]
MKLRLTTGGALGWALMSGTLLAVDARAACEGATPPRVLSQAEAREDLELSIASLEQAFPALDWHHPKRHWQEATRAARARLSSVEDDFGLYQLMASLLASLGEDHLTLRLSDAMRCRFRAEARLFPLDLYWTDQGAYVLRGHGDAADVPTGARLLAINGQSWEDLFHEMWLAVGGDGDVATGVMRELDGGGYARQRYLLRGAEQRFQVRLHLPDSTLREVALTPVPVAARPPEDDARSPLATLRWVDEHTALLRVPTFSNRRYREAGTSYPDTLKALFEELEQRKARDLILDLRDNGGGSESNENVLFSYLVEQPFRKYAFVEVRAQHLSVTSTSGQQFEQTVFEPEELATYRQTRRGTLRRLDLPPLGLKSHWRPVSPVFKGRLVVLVGGRTYSGAAELASMLYSQGRGLFIGEEVGGTYEGNSSGYSWELTLPNSRMELSVPLLHFRLNVSGLPRNRGVIPHCVLQPDVREYGVQEDAVYRLAVDLLHHKWRTPNSRLCMLSGGHGVSAK